MSQHSPARELPPPLELECLKALWLLGEGNVRQVRSAMSPHRPLAYTTVMTIMDRLARRGCVRRTKSGRSFVYTALLTRDDVRRLAVRELLESLFDGSSHTLRSFLHNEEAVLEVVAVNELSASGDLLLKQEAAAAV